MMTKRMIWNCQGKKLEIGNRPLVMGILNVTPDSFSDGGEHFEKVNAIERGLNMLEEGVDIIDVGGESSRPGAEPVPESEELKRVLPVVRELSGDPRAIISIDTTKAVVAERAIAAGAIIINDISAMTFDSSMVEVALETQAGLVLMHMQGNPRTMQKEPAYKDVVDEVNTYLRQRMELLEGQGVKRGNMAIDPGIGFGKTLEQNLSLIDGMGSFREHDVPVIVGLSRKSFLGRITGRSVDERLSGSLTAMIYSILKGAHIVRVHDVKESVDAVKVCEALMKHSQQGY